MNSWYVETLLRNKEEIRSAIVTRVESCGEIGYDVDLDDDDYNNLLLIENALRSLLKNKNLSRKEITVIDTILSRKSMRQLERETGTSRITLSKIFSRVCDRVAYLLGQEFTDDGYLEYLREKYNLSEEQIRTAKEYMVSNKRHAQLRPRRIH